MDQFLRDHTPFLKDLGERAGKTFAGGFLYGLGSDALAAFQTGGVAASDLHWVHAIDVGVGTTVLSLVFSAASLKIGNSGTASLTNAVRPVKQ